jgi:hypothetical protein
MHMETRQEVRGRCGEVERLVSYTKTYRVEQLGAFVYGHEA